MKRLIYLVIIIITINNISCEKKEKFEDKIKWQTFHFESDSIFGKYIEKLGMFIPVKVENDTTTYKMQFDTGANMTEFYENPIREINSISKKIDTFNVNQYSTSIGLYLDKYKSQIKAFPIRKEYGIKNSKLIGTIGSNEFKDKILIIDYPNEKFTVLDSVSKKYRNLFEFVDFEKSEGQTFLNFNINDKDYRFLFDTGSSTTPLITNMDLYNKLTGKNKTDLDTIKAFSWGIKVVAPGAKNIYPLKIGNIELKSKMRVYGTEAKHTLDFFKSTNIDGLISNPYFFEDVIFIDFRNDKFGVKK